MFKRIKAIWSNPSEGFGDTFKKITLFFGIKPCPSCEKRRKEWNKRINYTKNKRLKDVEK